VGGLSRSKASSVPSLREFAGVLSSQAIQRQSKTLEADVGELRTDVFPLVPLIRTLFARRKIRGRPQNQRFNDTDDASGRQSETQEQPHNPPGHCIASHGPKFMASGSRPQVHGLKFMASGSEPGSE
jgi:hypothetical protein